MAPQPQPLGHHHPTAEGRGPCRQAAFAAAWAAFAALAGGSLQGCAVKFLSSKRESKSPLEVCPAFRFQGNGFVAEARAGEVVNITCPTDFTYYGPAIECSWVDRFCVAYDQNKINPEFCYNQYNLTLAGQGLTTWPEDVEPKIMPPPTAGGGVAMPGMPGPQPAASANASRVVTGRRLATSLPQIVTPDRLSCRDEARRGHRKAPAPAGRWSVGDRAQDRTKSSSSPKSAGSQGWADLNFEQAIVDSSQRLDDKYAWSLRYRDITIVQGHKVDLLVTTVKVNITGNPKRTGKGSAMGRININCSNTVPFKFKFVKALTGEPVTAQKVFFTLFDIVDAADAKNDKQVTIGSMQEYFVSKSTRVVVEKLDNGEYTFGRGPINENLPGKALNVGQASVKDMWLDSLNRTVVLMFRNISEFMIYVKVTPGPHGRDFEFTGWSEVARYGRKVFCGPQQEMEAQAKFGGADLGEELSPERSPAPVASPATLAGLAALLGLGVAVRRRLLREPPAKYTAYPASRGLAME